VRWRDINFDLGTALVTGGEHGTKNHQARTIPLFGPLRRLIEAIRERKKPLSDDQLVFDIGAARLQLMRACERLGFPRLVTTRCAIFSARMQSRPAAILRLSLNGSVIRTAEFSLQ
jgi:integrase